MCEQEYLIRLENTIISRMNISFMSAIDRIQQSKILNRISLRQKSKTKQRKKGGKNIYFGLFPIHSTLIYYEKKCDNNIQ